MTSVLLYIHILAAGTWIGTNDRMSKESDEVAVGWLNAVVRWGTLIYAPAR